jgi:pyruvate/2-oxoglutarate dehydrogenase complex dihydrolipoamide acyltransferase (E2) component
VLAAIVDGMDVFGFVVNVVLVGLTALVILFARQTVTESRKATKAAQDTVTAVGDLLAVARSTAAASEAAATAARQTVAAAQELVTATGQMIQVARAARAADERDRQVRQVRGIGRLAEELFWKAAAETDWQGRTAGWRVMEHNYLQQALVGLEDTLPNCVMLTQANLAASAMGTASQARYEVTQAIKQLTEQPLITAEGPAGG